MPLSEGRWQGRLAGGAGLRRGVTGGRGRDAGIRVIIYRWWCIPNGGVFNMVVYSDKKERPLGRGRPRSADAGQKILSSALELLVERGYEGATIGAVAMHAHVGSKTIYRRFANRTEMLAAAIDEGVGTRPVENTGHTRTDLRMMLSMLARFMLRGSSMRLLGTVLTEERRHPELVASYRRRVVWPRMRLMKAVLERGQRRGEVREGVNLDIAVELFWGAVFAKYMSGVDGEEGFVDGVMDVMLPAIDGIPDGSEV